MEIKYIIFWIVVAIIVVMIILTWKQDLQVDVEKLFEKKEEKKEEIFKSEYPKDLKKWLAYTKRKNFSIDELRTLILQEEDCDFTEVYEKLKGGYGAQKKAEYLFKQWNTPKKPRTKKVQTLAAPKAKKSNN